MLEDSARRAVEAAGFVPAAEGAVPDVSVQVGARVTATERSPCDDPFWYGPYGWPVPAIRLRPLRPAATGARTAVLGPYGRYGAWGPGYYGYTPYYEREVAVLIRDKKTGEPLYEARANSEGMSSASIELLPSMFAAALHGFPAGGPTNPRRVKVDTHHRHDDPVSPGSGAVSAPSPARARKLVLPALELLRRLLALLGAW